MASSVKDGVLYNKLPINETESVSSPRPNSNDLETSLFIHHERRPYHRPYRWPTVKLIIVFTTIQVLFLVAYTCVILKIVQGRSVTTCRPRLEDMVISPAKEALLWESRQMQTRVHTKTIYNNDPSPELDEAWNDLVSMSNIKIAADELRGLNKTTWVEIPDEPGMVWATLGVNHELHCLKRIRQALYPKYYFPDYTEEELELNLLHSGHCIDYLRQIAMCRGDVSLTTYYWKPDERLPVADFDAPHACANWDALVDWQRDRLVDIMRPGWLRHPTLGSAFPDGLGAAIGVVSERK